MIREIAGSGCDAFFMTPHFYPHECSLEDFTARRGRSLEKLRGEIDLSDMTFAVGCEVYLSPMLFISEDLSQICIGESSYALVEMPFSPDWGKKIFELLDSLIYEHKISPILAHVERYSYFKRFPEVLDALTARGCLVQINAESLLGSIFSREHAFKMLKANKVHLLGSDCHNTTSRRPNLEKARNIIKKKLGAGCLSFIDSHSEKIAVSALGT